MDHDSLALRTEPLVQDLTARLNRALHDERLWQVLGEALFRKGDMEALRTLFNWRSSTHGQAMDFAYDLFVGLAASPGADLRLQRDRLAAYPDDCPFSAAAMMVGGMLDVLAFDLDRASDRLRQAFFRFKRIEQALPSEGFVRSIYYEDRVRHLARNAFLCEPSSWVPAVSLPRPEMVFPNGLPQSAVLACATCAESFYVRHHAESFLARISAALGPGCSALVGVINPDPDVRTKLDRLGSIFPAACFFIVELPGGSRPWAAATMRFILANRLLDLLACPTLFLSIDNDLSFPRLGEALRAVAEAPLSLQILKASPQKAYRLLSPDSMIDPGLVGAHPGPSSRRFFEDVTSYLLGKLTVTESELPLWNIDRVALYRAACLVRSRGDEAADSATSKAHGGVPVFSRQPLYRLVDDWARRAPVAEPVQETVDIAFAADADYLGYTAVALASLLKNYRGRRPLRVFMLLDQLMPEEDLRRYQTLSALHPFALHQLVVDVGAFSQLGAPGQITVATYNRLVMYSSLPADCRKILYLDSDLLVLESIDALFDAAFDGAFFAGVGEGKGTATRALHGFNFPEGGVYIDPGVLLANVDAIRAVDFTGLIQRYLDRNGHCVTLADQQIFVELFCLRIKRAPLKWNVVGWYFDPQWVKENLSFRSAADKESFQEALADPGILHYVGPDKPWKSLRHPKARLWHSHLDLTAYAAGMAKPEGWDAALS